MRKVFSMLALTTLMGAPALLAAETEPDTPVQVQLFPLDAVKISEGPFLEAQQASLNYILEHDPDRFLAPFRREAGLEPLAENYPDWESTGLDGHTGGHYLTGLAQMVAATGNEECRKRLDYMVEQLAACQAANGNGYVGGVPNSKELWDEIRKGDIRAGGFDLNGSWVPWYNLHKLYAGLRDAYTIAGNKQALTVLVGLSNWAADLTDNLSDEQMQEMLACEHGGMNEVLADVAAITADERHLKTARRFSHRAILDPLAESRDDLTGKHANTQIPKVVGAQRIYELSGDPYFGSAAEFFWQIVTRNRSVAIGGNSVGEHFNPVDDYSRMIEDRSGPETCNTYNMMRLTEELFKTNPKAAYADYYERAMLNHILSSQHPEHGGLVYFTPMRPGHYRVYSKAETNFWCCVGTGLENHSKYGRFIYARSPGTLYVNLFVDSELSWPDQGLTISQSTKLPEEGAAALKVGVAEPTALAVKIRHPHWVTANDFKVSVNGETQKRASHPGEYVTLDRTWKDGDTIELTMPMNTYVERLPDGSDYVAILHGPNVLAARMGNWEMPDVLPPPGEIHNQLADGPLLPLHEAPSLVGTTGELQSKIQPVSGRPLHFKIPGMIRPENYGELVLGPLHDLHDQRYAIYWRLVSESEYKWILEKAAKQERLRQALDERTTDIVTPGEQQSEVDHAVETGESSMGYWSGRSFRHGQNFSYLMDTENKSLLGLRVLYWGGDVRRFDILINDKVLVSESLEGDLGAEFVPKTYAIPREILEQGEDGKVRVGFDAEPDSMAGGIYEIRLVQLDEDGRLDLGEDSPANEGPKE